MGGSSPLPLTTWVVTLTCSPPGLRFELDVVSLLERTVLHGLQQPLTQAGDEFTLLSAV
jgi:hypothetical protein